MTTEKEFWEFTGRYFRTIASIQNVIDNLQKDSALSKDLRAIKSMKRIENIMKDFGKPGDTIIDECVGCAGPCKVVDAAANLQKELANYETTICRMLESSAAKDKLIEQQKTTIRTFKILETKETDRLHKIIEELKDRNADDLNELYDLDKAEIDCLKSQLAEECAIIDKITGLRVNEVETLYALEAELSVCKKDSAVLMKVVDAVKPWQLNETGSANTVIRVYELVKDYLSAPEGPPETPVDETPDIAIVFTFGEIL